MHLRQKLVAAILAATSAAVSVGCVPLGFGPLGDRPLGATLEGRRHIAACFTRVPASSLSDDVAAVTVDVPRYVPAPEVRQIAGVDLGDAFAVRMPKEQCASRATWVVFCNDELASSRIDELIEPFDTRGAAP